MGNNFGAAHGYNVTPPITAEESAEGILREVSAATRETHGGKFIDYKGTSVPW